ncbi:MAG: N-acetyltransferase [Deltaproteobacteria bacterium]|nr:MAG: N-acetyltransferase [Deltaproteobacteria bacterium]TMA54667.1 MAG: N-acetyltransferase [Deltaproteobacteria bacterium]
MARDPSVFVHEKGLCESDDVGARTRVWAFAHVMRGATVGADCNIGDHAFVESGARIGNRVTVKNAVLVWDGVTVEDEVFLGPNMVFTNVRDLRAALRPRPEQFLPTLVRRGASIGANATIVCGVTVGERALVAAGSVVTGDVPAYALVAGNPARFRRWVCACGEALPEDLGCGCGRRYRLLDARTGLAPIG